MAFLASMGNYMVLPFLAIYLRTVLGLPVGWVGLLVGLPFLSATVFGPLGGYVADHWGLRRAYAAQAGLYALAAAGLGVAQSGWQAALWLVLAGVTIPVSQSGLRALMNEALPASVRGLGQNYIYWANNVGVVVGLLVASRWLGAGRDALPFWVLAAISVVLGTTAWAWGREPERPPGKTAESPSAAGTLHALGSDRALRYAVLTAIALVILQAQLSSTVPIAIASHFVNGSALFGPLLALNGVVVVAAEPLALRLLARTRPALLFWVGAVAMAAGLAMGGIGQSLGAWVVGMLVLSAGEVLWATTLNDFLGILPTPGHTSLYFATTLAAQALGFFLGTTVGALLYRQLGAAWFGTLAVWSIGGGVCFSLAVAALRRRQLQTLAMGLASASWLTGGGPGEQRARLAGDAETNGPVFRGAAVLLSTQGRSDPENYGIPAPPERLAWLEHLSEEDRATLLSHMPRRRFRAGDVLIRQGERARTLYVVTDGELEVVLGSGDGARRLTQVPTGSVFGEQAFFDGEPRSATVRAVTDGEVRELTWPDVDRLAAVDSSLALLVLADLTRIVSTRLRLTTESLSRL